MSEEIMMLSLAYNPLWALAVVPVSLAILVLVVRPAWGLYPLLLAVALIPPVGVVSLLDYHLTPVDLYMILFTPLWLAHKLVAGTGIKRSPLLVSMIVVVLVRFLSIFATADLIVRSSISFLRYVEWLLVFVIVVDVARTQDAIRLLRVFLAIIWFQSILSLGQATLSFGIGQHPISRGGTLGEIGIPLAFLQVYAILIGFSLARLARVLWKRVAWGAFNVIVILGLVSTFGRTAWLSTVVGLFTYQWLGRTVSVVPKVKGVIWSLLTVGLALGILFTFNRLLFEAVVPYAATFTALGETYSFTERLTLWRVGIGMFLQHPVIGVGTGNYVDLLSQIVGPEEALTPHNAVVSVLSETGLLGLVAYLFFASRVVAIIRSDLRKYKGSNLYPILLPLGSAIVALLLTDWIGWTSFYVWSMLFLALYVVLRRGTEHERRSSQNLLPR